MPIDPSIPLSVNQFDVGRVAQGANQLMALRQNMQKDQAQNALKQLLSDPSNLDPATGQPTPNALMKITAISPDMGMKLQENALTLQADRARLGEMQMKRVGEIQGLIEPVRDSALNAYEDTLKSTGDQTAAEAAGQRAMNEGLAPIRSGGLLSDNEKQQLRSKFDYGAMRTQALTYSQRKAAEEKQKADDRADARLKLEDKRTDEQARRTDSLIAASEKKDPTAAKWDVRQDKDGTEYRYNASTAQATTLDGKPYSIRGAAGKVGAAKDEGEGMTPDAIRLAAQQYLAGDRGAIQNVGRGTQGSKDLRAIRGEIAKQAAASDMSGADIAAKMAEFDGVKAGERTLSTRSANIEMAVNEASQFADLAKMASEKVGRTKFIPINRAMQAWEKNTGDPEIRAFGAANNSFINAYARAVSPSGTPTVSDKEHAREMLETADSQEQYDAVLSQLQKEMAAAQKSPGVVRDELRKAVSGGDKPATVAAPSTEIKTKSETAWGSYEPDKYDYRVSPETGTLQRKAK